MIERAVRRESRNATDLRIVLLEDERFVTVHSRKVKPLVPGRMLDKVGQNEPFDSLPRDTPDTFAFYRDTLA